MSKNHHKGNTACARLDLKVSHFDDIVITEKCQEDLGSLKSAVLKVLKGGLILVREEVKHRKELKRTGGRDSVIREEEDIEDEE